ncbi:MAG: hypothetical protein J0I11_07375 [Actinobacteria bacterium]|jgi:hypothetical protein|nr:hypothetical protein [Actinomycetota bacterium]
MSEARVARLRVPARGERFRLCCTGSFGGPGGFVVALVAAVVLLAGCTHHRTSGDATVSSGTAGGPSPAAGAPATAGPGGSAAGPAVVTAVVGGVTTAITLPPNSEPLGAVPTHQPGPADAALAAVLPGAYGLDSLGASVHGATISLAAQGSCGFVRDVIGSGQWALTPVVTPHDGAKVYLDVLTRGDRRALLTLTESANLCTGRILTETSLPLTATGSVTASGQPRAITMYCLEQEGADSPTRDMAVFYRTADAALVIMATVPEALGAHSVDPDEPAGVIQFDPHADPLVHAAKAMKMFFDPTGITQDAMLPGVSEEQAWFQGDGATVTVTSLKPFAGTLDAPVLQRSSGGGSARVSAGFSC